MAEKISDLLPALQANLSILEKIFVSIPYKTPSLEEAIANTKSVISQLEASIFPICYDHKDDLLETPCHHVFCEDCIMEWLEPAKDEEDDHETSPACRSALSSVDLRPVERQKKSSSQPVIENLDRKLWYRPVFDLLDLTDDGIRSKAQAVQKRFPSNTISSCLTALAKRSWRIEDAVEYLLSGKDEEDVWEVHVLFQSLLRNGQFIFE